MAHEIMGQRFIARSKPAWHNIAKRIFGEDERITAGEAMADVAGDIDVRSYPLTYTFEGRTVETDKRMLVRMPTFDSPIRIELGIATDSWVAASYAELAEALNDLGNRYKVETAGLLQDGGLAFLCFRGPNYDVKGDEMRDYFTANFSLTPGVGHKIFKSDVRTVCWNTNTQGERNATINLSIPHSKDVKLRVQLASRLAGQFHELSEKTQGIFTAFAERQVDQKDVDAIIYAAFQLPELPSKLKLLKQTLSEAESNAFKAALTPTLLADLAKAEETWDRQCQNVLALRAAAQESFEKFNPANLRGTAWAAYNAVTEVADWREGRNADESAVIGTRAKEKGRAFMAAMALVK